jgi:hypothetical protein
VRGDPPLERIAAALEGIEQRQKEQLLAQAQKTVDDNRREFVALVTIGVTALLVVVSASNIATRFGPFAQNLKDYQPLVAVGLTILVATVYRAFQLRVIPLELVVGLGLGVMVAAALTLWPIVHSTWIGGVLAGLFFVLAFALLANVKWDFGAERAAAISTTVILLILWAAGLITVNFGGANWLKLGFVGETLLTIDSAFPRLVMLDVLGSAAAGLAFFFLYRRWRFFRESVIKVGDVFDVDSHDEDLFGAFVATSLVIVVMIVLVSNDPLTGFAHVHWLVFG